MEFAVRNCLALSESAQLTQNPKRKRAPKSEVFLFLEARRRKGTEPDVTIRNDSEVPGPVGTSLKGFQHPLAGGFRTGSSNPQENYTALRRQTQAKSQFTKIFVMRKEQPAIRLRAFEDHVIRSRAHALLDRQHIMAACRNARIIEPAIFSFATIFNGSRLEFKPGLDRSFRCLEPHSHRKGTPECPYVPDARIP
jgi:hypothetical protein